MAHQDYWLVVIGLALPSDEKGLAELLDLAMCEDVREQLPEHFMEC